MRFFYKISCLTYIALCLSAFSAHAAIEYSESNILNFGEVQKQTGADVTVTVSENDGGQLTIKDKAKNVPDIKVTIQSDPNSCSTPSTIRIKDFAVKYDNGSVQNFIGEGPFVLSGLSNPGKKGKKLQYGATVVVEPEAPSSASEYQRPCYYVKMEYDCVSGASGCPSDAPLVANLQAEVKALGIPVALTEDQAMNFGAMVSPSSNSSLKLQPGGSLSVASGNLILVGGGVGSPAIFDVIAEKNVSISVYASPGAAVSGMSLGNMMGSFSGSNMPQGINMTNANNAQLFNTSETGNDTLVVGATLSVPKNVASGTYNLNYNLIIDYQ